MIPAITLDDLRAYDPSASTSPSSTRWRFRCPCAECGGKTARTFDVDWGQGVYLCWRCGAKGKLGGQTRFSQREVRQAQRDESDRKRKMWRETKMVRLADTAGARYLDGRGIPLAVSRKAGILFCRSFFSRPAVMFPVKDAAGVVVALQGRYISKEADPKTRTIGKVSTGVFTTAGAWDAEQITITEAPIDALSLLLLGMPAIATMGTNLPDFIRARVQGRDVVIATDADDAGDAAYEKWLKVLCPVAASVERLRPVGGKDWNDILCRTRR